MSKRPVFYEEYALSSKRRLEQFIRGHFPSDSSDDEMSDNDSSVIYVRDFDYILLMPKKSLLIELFEF